MSPREVICCTSSADCSKSCMSGRGGDCHISLWAAKTAILFFWMSPPNFDALLLLGEFPIRFYLWYKYIYIIVFWHQTMYPLYVRITLEPLFAKVVQIHVLFFLDAWQILRKTQEHFFGKWCSLYQVLKCTCSFTNGFSSLFPEVSSVHFFVWAKGIACLDSYFCQTLQPWMLFFLTRAFASKQRHYYLSVTIHSGSFWIFMFILAVL
jgi:hypothetical protein